MNSRKLVKIAFVGKMRTGKTIAATHLASSKSYHSMSFGQTLMHFADKLFINSVSYPTEIGKKPRKLYQDFGQAMRALDPDIWIKHVEQSMGIYEDFLSIKGFVIDDLRQPNEMEWAKSNGFTIVRINASDKDRRKRAVDEGDVFTEADLTHETESHIDGFSVDYDIYNDGSYGDLLMKIEEIAKEVEEGLGD